MICFGLEATKLGSSDLMEKAGDKTRCVFWYPPGMEKEHHLQKCHLKGYVSSQEGKYPMN